MHVSVKVTFRDDTSKVWKCYDTPFVGDAWVTLYPLTNNMKRKMIRTEGISEIEWKVVHKPH